MKQLKFNCDSHFLEYRNKEMFIDCEISIPDRDPIIAHRIILSKNSSFFLYFFKERPFDHKNIQIQVPFLIKNDETFRQIIDFFYTDTILPSVTNFGKLYGYSILYGIHSLELILQSLIIPMKIPKIEIIKTFSLFFDIIDAAPPEFKGKSGKKIKNESKKTFRDECRHLLSRFREITNRIIDPSDFAPFSLEQIINFSHKYIFAQYLRKIDMKDFEKFNCIMKFIEIKKIKDNETDYLRDVIDCVDNFAIELTHDIKWLPIEIQRKIYQKIFRNRKQSIDSFLRTDNPGYNWYYLLSLFSIIYFAQGQTEIPRVDIIKYLGCLCDLNSNKIFFNPSGYFFQIDSTAAIDEVIFSKNHAFDDTENYFLAKDFKMEIYFNEPIEFDEIRIEYVGTMCKEHAYINSRTFTVEIKTWIDEFNSDTKESNNIIYKDVSNERNRKIRTHIAEIPSKTVGTKILIYSNESPSLFCYRIKRIRVKGKILKN